MDPNYVDPSTQPTPFKTYPHFFRRFQLDCGQPMQSFLHFTSAITFQKQYRDGVYSLRVNPSAGALYPTEVYVQLRGIAGLIDGLYHLEVKTNSLTLIYELIDDGLEAYLNDVRLIRGCILLISCAYFRSSWKYKHRSLRYCFLDAGHHLGAIEASAFAHGLATEVQFDFDHDALNRDLGLTPQEFLTAAVVVGERREKSVRRLRSPLPFVPATDYFEPSSFVEAGYQATLVPAQHFQPLAQPQFPIAPAALLAAAQQRRSARRFQPAQIGHAAFQSLWTFLRQPIATAQGESVELLAVVQDVAGIPPGLYRENHCLQLGSFRETVGYLCVNQAIARDSAVLFFVVAEGQNYRVALQKAGILGQRLYLAATHLDLGCSGIGAYFDDETQAFLHTEQMVLYAIAVGVSPG